MNLPFNLATTITKPASIDVSRLLQLINAGKGEALRIRAILRSLVPTVDLVGIISIPLKMPVVNKGMFVPVLLSSYLSGARRHADEVIQI